MSRRRRTTDLTKPITWGEYVEHIARRDACSMSEAGRRALKEFPAVHPLAKIKTAKGGRL